MANVNEADFKYPYEIIKERIKTNAGKLSGCDDGGHCGGMPYEQVWRKAKFVSTKVLMDPSSYISATYVSKVGTAGVSKSPAISAPAASTSKIKVKSDVYSRTKVDLACDIVGLVVVYLLAVLSLLFFAVPTMEMGGQVYKGNVQSMWSFTYFNDNSLYVQIKSAIETISQTFSENSDAEFEGVSSIIKLVRLIFLAVPAVCITLRTLINVISAPIYFAKKRSRDLFNILIKTVGLSLLAYVCFSFFGSVSGGTGDDEYYIGYTVGVGMSVGVLIAIAVLLMLAFVTFIVNRKKDRIKSEEGMNWRSIFVVAVASSAIAVVVTFLRIYSVFSYVLSSSLTSAATAIASGNFDFKSLVFPLLNLIILWSSCSVYRRTTEELRFSFMHVVIYSKKQVELPQNYEKKQKKALRGLIFIGCLAVVCLIATIILNIPDLGYGWSVNVYEEYLAIFVIAFTGQAFVSFFRPKKAKQK